MPKGFDPDRAIQDAQKALADAQTRRAAAVKKVEPIQARLDKAKEAVTTQDVQIARLQAYLADNGAGPSEMDDDGLLDNAVPTTV